MKKVPRHSVAVALGSRSLGSAKSAKFSEEIAAFLIAERRISELDSLMRDIMQYRSEEGIVEVVAVTSHELTSEMEHDIEDHVRALYPDAKRVLISPEHDANVVGGVRLEFPHQQLDLSIRNKLSHFKQLTAAGKE